MPEPTATDPLLTAPVGADPVLTVTDGAVTLVRINRPEVHNALNLAVLAALRGAVESAAADPAVRVVVLTGTGGKAFSAGADLKEVAGLSPDRAHRAMRHGQRTMRAIERAEIPVIAAVNGVALGGGFELVLASTFPVLSRTASLGLPESGLGLIPGYGGTQRLPRAVGAPTAAHLMLTGARLDAERAHRLGLAPVPPVEPEDLLGTALRAARRIAEQGPLAVRSILRALETGRDAALDTGLTAETGLASLALAGPESAEGIAAFLERRAAHFDARDGEW
ncbi:enoyl-CoA hydratase/isomerase family protein [Streptomyces coelicoflavus]|uniref:enoyl-CoA hydratase/isomerase family protein n=1 Tax=Streptomyces coelicoflavus TaxID=285562 RepID=UPI0024AE79F4|nr:enoyl-CoA hydratase/isomerase family protein [Streptomyces coelicoflavus]MDI6520319.1 enoyl-CoA hydratase/isomerase family protein [Streptomyces coelicoflavus]